MCANTSQSLLRLTFLSLFLSCSVSAAKTLSTPLFKRLVSSKTQEAELSSLSMKPENLLKAAKSVLDSGEEDEDESKIYEMVNNQNVEIISQVSNGICNSKLINSYLPADMHHFRDKSQPSLDMKIFCPSVRNSCCGDHSLRYFMHLYLAKKLMLLKIKAANEDIFRLFGSINETEVSFLFNSAPTCFNHLTSQEVYDKIVGLKTAPMQKWSDLYFKRKLNFFKGFVCSICSAKKSQFFDIVKLRNSEIQSMVQISENMCFDYLEEHNSIEKIKKLFGEILLILGSMNCAVKFMRIQNKHVLKQFFNSSAGRVLATKEISRSEILDQQSGESLSFTGKLRQVVNKISVGESESVLSGNILLAKKTESSPGSKINTQISDGFLMHTPSLVDYKTESHPYSQELNDIDEDFNHVGVKSLSHLSGSENSLKEMTHSSSFRIKEKMPVLSVINLDGYSEEESSLLEDEEMSMVMLDTTYQPPSNYPMDQMSNDSSEKLFRDNNTVQRIKNRLQKINFPNGEVLKKDSHFKSENLRNDDENDPRENTRPRDHLRNALGRFKSETQISELFLQPKRRKMRPKMKNRSYIKTTDRPSTERTHRDSAPIELTRWATDRDGSMTNESRRFLKMPSNLDLAEEFPIYTDDEHERMSDSNESDIKSISSVNTSYMREGGMFDSNDKTKIRLVMKRLRDKMQSGQHNTEQNVNIRSHNKNFMDKCRGIRFAKTLKYSDKLLKASCLTFCRKNMLLTRMKFSRTYFKELFEVYEILSDIVISSDSENFRLPGEGAFSMRRLFGDQDDKKFQRLKKDFKNSGIDLEEMGLGSFNKKPMLVFYRYNHGGAYDFDKFFLIEITKNSGLDLYKDNMGNFGLFGAKFAGILSRVGVWLLAICLVGSF